MGYGGFEMGFFWYAGYEFQKVGEKSGMRDWAPPPPLPPYIAFILLDDVQDILQYPQMRILVKSIF